MALTLTPVTPELLFLVPLEVPEAPEMEPVITNFADARRVFHDFAALAAEFSSFADLKASV